MHPLAILRLLILLTVANGTPVVAKRVLNDRFAWPLDCGVRFFDGRALLGRSKTVRGTVLAVVATSLGAWAMGLGWRVGAFVGAAAMAGDVFSSFLKRRFDLAPSSQAIGLDQIPESLLPAVACAGALSLTAADVGLAVGVFFLGEVVLSRVFYRLGLRDRPY
jgi:hypothetical protein